MSGVLARIKRLYRRTRRGIASVPRPSRKSCVACGRRVGRFLPYRGGAPTLPKLPAVLASIGSDVDQFECPRCGAHDRERHLLMYFRALGLFEAMPAIRILHFAPEPHLSRWIVAAAPAGYVKCDLHPTAADVQRVDMEAMPFADATFDLVIANHVLEHVDDDLRALREIRRVLRPGGRAVLQTPYCAALHATWSDPGIATDAARLQAYGQEDHVRLFGRDIFQRFASAGLRARVQSHAELLPGLDATEYGVNPAEPLFLFEHPG